MPARSPTRAASAQPRHGPVPAPPTRAFLDLGAIPTAPGCARAWTREILWEWGLAAVADPAETVVSEFVTNSVNACRGSNQAVIRVTLTFNRDELAILVRDDHPGFPLPGTPGEDDESGRGLLLARNLSDRSGWYPLEDGDPGKVVWAVLTGCGQPRSGQGRKEPGALRKAEVIVPDGRPAPALAARGGAVSPSLTGMGALKWTPVDLDILARVKVALERL
jgi:anti-sigma regulatory factor (Ser/Thr protein kinase)